MSKLSTRAHDGKFPFFFNACRNISAPEDADAGRKVLAGNAPASSFVDLNDDENVREYLVDAVGKQKRSSTLVHKAIRDTLKDYPDLFSILNGGICIVARGAEIDDSRKQLFLDRPSIINGSQTQGELIGYLRGFQDGPPLMPSVTFQVVVTDDDELIAQISIARNFQNDVRAISIAGRLKQLDELESALQRTFPAARLRKSETDLSEAYIETEKLIQVLFAIAPDSLWESFDEKVPLNKAFTYSQKTRCLKTFQRIVEGRKKPDESESHRQLYEFFLDVVAEAWTLYERWKCHPGFKGTGIRSIVRDARGAILEIPDGIVFPCLAAFSAFATRRSGTWKIEVPPSFDEAELIDAAKSVYQEIANHQPQLMGKNKACYSSLLRVTSIYAKLDAR